MIYALLAVPKDEIDLQIVALKDYDPAWVQALREAGNPKAAFIRDVMVSPPPDPVPRGQQARKVYVLEGERVRQDWALDVLPVPVVDDLQIRRALTAVGLRDAVEAAVAAGSQDLRDYWDRRLQFHVDHPLVVAMAAAIGVPRHDLEALFWQASTL
ncbi:MAG: hypothetical protein ACT4QA_22665 [Panacagrimonas sp.]